MKKSDEEKAVDQVKTKPNLSMSFDARDVIDVLVSDQEQHIENQVDALKLKLETVTNDIIKNNDEIEKYTKEFAKTKYGDKVSAITKTFEDIGAKISIRFEVIDGSDLPRRSSVVFTSNSAHEDKTNKLIVSLIICNTEFDRNTVDNEILFYLESEYDDKLKEMKNKDEKLNEEQQQLKKQIKELEITLSKTDRLVRRAKASVTKKAIKSDVDEFLTDFKATYLKDGETDFKKIELK
jgi:peptidoglycan hydrolase CwlO-like protein